MGESGSLDDEIYDKRNDLVALGFHIPHDLRATPAAAIDCLIVELVHNPVPGGEEILQAVDLAIRQLGV